MFIFYSWTICHVGTREHKTHAPCCIRIYVNILVIYWCLCRCVCVGEKGQRDFKAYYCRYWANIATHLKVVWSRASLLLTYFRAKPERGRRLYSTPPRRAEPSLPAPEMSYCIPGTWYVKVIPGVVCWYSLQEIDLKLPLTNTHISLFVTVFTPPTPAGNHRYSQYFAPSTQQVIKSASQIEGPALIFPPEISRSQSDIFTTRMMPSELQTNKNTQFYCVSKCARRPRIVLAHEQLFTQLAGAGAQAQITSTIFLRGHDKSGAWGARLPHLKFRDAIQVTMRTTPTAFNCRVDVLINKKGCCLLLSWARLLYSTLR